MFKKILLSAAAVTVMMSSPAFAFDEAAAKKMVDETINKWLLDAQVLDAVKAQNTETSAFDQAKIDDVDAKWKAGDAGTVDKVMNSKLSAFLKDVLVKSDGLYTEIIIMDAKGLNVGLSDKTSDAWQGDEDKFTKSFGAGAGSVHLGEVELDESSQTYSQQLSVPIVDGGTLIGAATIGLNADKLPK